jgi:hypothetical protein
MSNKPSASDTGFSTDRLRSIAVGQWFETLKKVERLNVEIVGLAAEGARLQYQEMAEGEITVLSMEHWSIEIIKRWTVMSALRHAHTNKLMKASLLEGSESFFERMEEMIRQTVPATDQSRL